MTAECEPPASRVAPETPSKLDHVYRAVLSLRGHGATLSDIAYLTGYPSTACAPMIWWITHRLRWTAEAGRRHITGEQVYIARYMLNWVRDSTWPKRATHGETR